MKYYYRIFLSLLLMTAFLSKVQAQTIWVANNNPGASGGTNVYTGSGAIDSCIAHAVASDIIHVIPSSISYGSVSLTKSLSVYGIGTNPGKEGTKTSIVDYVYIMADNCVVSGLTVKNYFEISGSGGPTTISGLLLENCNLDYGIIDYTTGRNVGNFTVRNNIFNGTYGYYRINLNFNTSSNVSITNNIIMVDNSSYGAININGGAVITNNIFVGNGGTSCWAFNNIDGNVIKNNIFYGAMPFGRTSTTNNTFVDNSSFGANDNSFLIGSNGNIGDSSFVNIDPAFINVPAGQLQWNFSYDPHLDTSLPSPLIGKGDDGTDIGLTGGGIPFNFAGTSLPLVTSVSIPSVIIQGNTLPATIKAKGN